MEGLEKSPQEKFTTPHEELSYLRERLKHLEGQVASAEAFVPREPARSVIAEHGRRRPEEVLAKGYAMLKPEVDAVVLDLAPESHDDTMAELLAVVRERGIRNALSVVERLGNPHIEDDFHRFLVEYLKEGHSAKGVKESEPLWKGLHLTLFEVMLPYGSDSGHERPLREILSSMEQLYAGALAVASEKGAEKNYFTLELAVESQNEYATVYAAVPTEKKELFEKQILSIFPQARLTEAKNDYNVFNPEGATVGAVASYAEEPAYPLKTYDAFDYDPLNILLSAFSKLTAVGEGAALQVVVRPSKTDYVGKFTRAIAKMHEGVPAREALDIPFSFGEKVSKKIRDMVVSTGTKKKGGGEEKPKTVDELAIEEVKQKTEHSIVETNLRLVASAPTETRAVAILADLEATFNQFEKARGNKLSFRRFVKSKHRELVRDFSFRLFDETSIVPLNLRELTTVFHLPSVGNEPSRELKRSKAGSAPVPVGLSREGVLLGVNRYSNVETPVHFGKDDRLRHFYCIGQTGTGKTTLLKNMIIQDIKNGEGVCMIDPHGTDILDVLANIPKERVDDVIYFDPAFTERPMGLNMLEYDTRYPEQKTFVVNELFSIFQKLYGKVPESMGPMFEQYFRNATMLVIEDPETGNTLFDVSRVMSDPAYRQLKLSRCKNPVVVQFWRDVAEKAGGEASLANIVPYVTSKFDVFLANDIMRPIVVQRASAFDFRKIMDERKILLVNLSKGRLGDINANLLGLIIVGKILMAALSRVDSLHEKTPDFYLYIDEFQNVTTDSIATILSEARKYHLSLTIAHQFIKQIDERIRDAVFGNVGSMCAFRVGSDDAEYLEKQFAPVFTANDLMNVDNRNAFVKLLISGRPERPFNIETLKPDAGDRAMVEVVKQLSYARFGRPREDVERELRESYGTT